MKYILVSLIFFISLQAGAKDKARPEEKKPTKVYLKDYDLPLPKGAKIRALNYNTHFKVYQIISVNHPAEGFSYTTLPLLKAATKGLNLKAIKEDPLYLINLDLTLVKDLQTLHVPSNVEIEAAAANKD